MIANSWTKNEVYSIKRNKTIDNQAILPESGKRRFSGFETVLFNRLYSD
jgi:hypothetical protein